MKERPIIRDERTVAVENASYRWAYLVLSFGLLAIVAYRGFIWQENNWDLMVLVILSSLVATLYQARGRILTRQSLLAAVITGVVAAVTAAVLTFFL